MSTSTSKAKTTRPASRTAPSNRPSSTTQRSGKRWLLAAVGVVAVGGVIGGVYAFSQGGGAPSTGGSAVPAGGTAPYVGGEVHVLANIGDRLYVGGHDGGARSSDAGQTWTALKSLNGADPMGWTATSAGLLVGGHPGLFRSSDDGATFTMVTGEGAVSDVHAIGGASTTAYLASPVAGLMASSDGGVTWETRNARAGQGFMGTILVDPADPARLVAPDMANGLVASSDGGATWTVLGGPGGTMSAAWDPTDPNRLVSIGMGESAISTDGGQKWTTLQVPTGTSAAVFSANGDTLYTAALIGTSARISASTDEGKTWTELG